MDELLIRRREMMTSLKRKFTLSFTILAGAKKALSLGLLYKGLFFIVWGDGTVDSTLSHTYTAVEEDREITVTAYGYFTQISIYNSGLTNIDIPDASTLTHALRLGRNKFTTLNTANWDLSNLTNIDKLFDRCNGIIALDVSNWNVSKVKRMNNAFCGCQFQTIDVSNWDVSNVTLMGLVFNGCTSLTTIDVSKWNVSKVTNMAAMFLGCQFQTIDVSNWDVSNVTYMNLMFLSCLKLETIDLSNWDLNNCTRAPGFYNDRALISVIGSKLLEDVEYGTVALKNLKVSFAAQHCHLLRYSSMLAIMNGIADLTGSTAATITFSPTAFRNMRNDDDTIPDNVTIEERQLTLTLIAAAKNWNLAY